MEDFVEHQIREIMHDNEFQATMDQTESAAGCVFKGVCKSLLEKQKKNIIVVF